MRDEIMRLADAAGARAKWGRGSATTPVQDSEGTSRLLELIATDLRALARTDHPEDKLGMVAEGWRVDVTTSQGMEPAYTIVSPWGSRYSPGAGGVAYDFLKAIATHPAPDHSAGVGGMVINDAMVERLAKHLCREEWKNRCPTIEQLTAQMKHARRYHDVPGRHRLAILQNDAGCTPSSRGSLIDHYGTEQAGFLQQPVRGYGSINNGVARHPQCTDHVATQVRFQLRKFRIRNNMTVQA